MHQTHTHIHSYIYIHTYVKAKPSLHPDNTEKLRLQSFTGETGKAHTPRNGDHQRTFLLVLAVLSHVRPLKIQELASDQTLWDLWPTDWPIKRKLLCKVWLPQVNKDKFLNCVKRGHGKFVEAKPLKFYSRRQVQDTMASFICSSSSNLINCQLMVLIEGIVFCFHSFSLDGF